MSTFMIRYSYNTAAGTPPSAPALAERKTAPTIVVAASLSAALAAIAALSLQYSIVSGIQQSTAIVLTA